jgi:hypothetical protein
VDLPAVGDLAELEVGVVDVERLADHVEHVAEGASPTGTVMPAPVLRTGVPRVRPSVGFRQMARTRLSPICWATSARTVTTVLPST